MVTSRHRRHGCSGQGWSGQSDAAGTNTYTGGTTINAGLLRVGNGNTNASGLGIAVGLGTGPVVDNGTLEFNLAGTNVFTNAITGTGALNVGGHTNLMIVLSTSNSFTGNVNVNSGGLGSRPRLLWEPGPRATKIVNVNNGTAGQSRLFLDGSLGNITTETNIEFYLSNVGGCLLQRIRQQHP